ncbi:MAG: DNA polymerase III subunit gamma/tau [Legionellaceae bacterium]|nr:DNA polymerase III subunit gamma/tau [Legionellaceae bacterium]
MTYLALARKWRPRTFAELVGQEHVSQAIINSLDQQRLHHAYLFTGTRGVGKTSIARLFAKSLNCEKGVSAQPCLQCVHCQSIEQGGFVDLLEVDAASRTGVEDTRQLLDNAQYLPASGRYKVFLIDEVHMLSTSSFNALLKTLEEPPAHVKFILATTDPQKVPLTVLSRCLQFHLRAIHPQKIQQHLVAILQAEHCECSPEPLLLLAEAANGSLRDALSLLDQALALAGGKTLTLACVQSMLGYTRQNYALRILQALARQDATDILTQCRAIQEEGGHFHYVLQQIQRYFHEMMLIQQIGTEHPLLTFDPNLPSLTQCFSAQDVQLLYQIALKAGSDIALAPTALIGFEVAMLRMLAFWPLTAQGSAGTKILTEAPTPTAAPTSSGMASSAMPDTGQSCPEHPPEALPVVSPTKEPIAASLPAVEARESGESKAAPAVVEKAEVAPIEAPDLMFASPDDWARLIPRLALSGFALNAAQNAVWQETNGSEIVLAVQPGHLSLFTAAVKERVCHALSQHFQKKIKLKLVSEALTATTPAIQKQQRQEQGLQAASSHLQQDAVFNALKENFSASVIKNSIESLQDEL